MEGTGTVEVQVARDHGFRKIVARDLIKTTDATAHSAKARVAGLKPYEDYYYRFATRDNESPVGRFRTALPPDSNQPVRFAFWSCQDFTAGFFNAHAHMVKEDLDFVICLGDYIYAEDDYPVRADGARRARRPGGQRGDAGSVPGQVHRLPHRPQPQKLHARYPMINDLGRPRGAGQLCRRCGTHRAASIRPLHYRMRGKAAGHHAYFECLPTYGAKIGHRERIYRAARFGKHVDLVILDSRTYRDDQPCGDAVVGPACPELDAPRAILGRQQLNFVKKRLASTTAAWKVLANELTIDADLLPRW